MNKTELLKQALQSRILILDGAMGSMIQTYQLSEADFRGRRFAAHPYDLQGNNEILNLTQPDIVRAIYTAFAAGASLLGVARALSGVPMLAPGDEGLVRIEEQQGQLVIRSFPDTVGLVDSASRLSLAEDCLIVEGSEGRWALTLST